MSEDILTRIARRMKDQASDIVARGVGGLTSTEVTIRTTQMIVLDTVADEIFAALKDIQNGQ